MAQLSYSASLLKIPVGTKTTQATPAMAPRFFATQNKLYDAIFGGLGHISGTVSLKGTPNTPVSRRVRLYREVDGMLIRDIWSGKDGAYRFGNIDPTQKYTVISYDYQHNFRAVDADNLTPDPLP